MILKSIPILNIQLGDVQFGANVYKVLYILELQEITTLPNKFKGYENKNRNQSNKGQSGQ